MDDYIITLFKIFVFLAIGIILIVIAFKFLIIKKNDNNDDNFVKI
jgi:hypothetical protein